MISDWTIYAVWSPTAEALVSVENWTRNWAEQDAQLIYDVLFDHAGEHEDDFADLQLEQASGMRQFWLRNGPAWLQQLPELDLWTQAMPMISVELDGWEDTCPYCDGDGYGKWMVSPDGLEYEAWEQYTEYEQAMLEDEGWRYVDDEECDECGGTGSVLRDQMTGEFIYG